VPHAATALHGPTGIGWRHAHYGALLEERPSLDFLEVHSENFFAAGGAALSLLEQARGAYGISLHGVGLALGSAAGVDTQHLDRLARLVERIDPLLVSDHACFARAPGPQGMVHAADLLPLPFNGEALDVLCANVQQVQDRLQRPLLVENLSAYLTLAGSDRSETDFLASLAQRTGCRLLVDVNNIYVNALNARISGTGGDPLQACMDWLDAIPHAAVGELHLAGHCAMDDIVIDDHGSRVCDDVWQLYAHAVRRFGAVPTLIEWDTAVPALEVLLQEAGRAGAVAAAALAMAEAA
jgi:uncharacterized protein (UPF0276 family)